jgi:uncharacterized membrane protein YgcG
MEGSYGPGYLEAIVVASGENLTAIWTQSGSQKITRTDDHNDLYTSYSVYHQPYAWSPNDNYPGLPGQDTFTFRNNANQPVTITLSNPLGSTSLVLTASTSGTTTGTTSGTGGGNTGGNTGGGNSGGGGGGAPSTWMLLALAPLIALRNIRPATNRNSKG